MGTVRVEEEGEQNAERTNSIIQVRMSFEQVQQQLYAIHIKAMDRLNLEDTVQSQRVQEWVNHVQATLGVLTSLRAKDIASRNRLWEL